MTIDVPKIICIYIIILFIMYICIIDGNIIENVSSFSSRKSDNLELKLESDYDGKKVSLDYLSSCIYSISKMKESELKNFFDDKYYSENSSNLKKVLANKVKIKDTKNNESYIEFVKKDVNENNQDVYVYNVLVTKKGLEFPESYSVLNNEESVDKNKSIDIHVIEISPYNYVLQVPEKEFVG